MTTLAETIKTAQLMDNNYSATIKAEGFKSRWELPADIMRTNHAIRTAFAAKVVADNAMHKAFEASRS